MRAASGRAQAWRRGRPGVGASIGIEELSPCAISSRARRWTTSLFMLVVLPRGARRRPRRPRARQPPPARDAARRLLRGGGHRRQPDHLARPRRRPRRSPTSAPGASTGGCSPGWRRRRSSARSSAATSPGVLPRDALLLVIAAVLLYSAFDLARWTPPRRAAPDDGTRPDLDIRGRGRSRGAVIGAARRRRRADPRLAAHARAAASSSASARARAAGTNLAVGFWVGVAGALGHLPSDAAGLDASPPSAPPPRSRARCSARGSPGGCRRSSSCAPSPPCCSWRGSPRRVEARRRSLRRDGRRPRAARPPSCSSASSASTRSTRRATSARPRSCWPAAAATRASRCELLGRTEERPNLVARLRGAGDGPTLCLLSHVDTVLADAGRVAARPVVGRRRRRRALGPRRAGHEVPDRGRGRRRRRARALGLAPGPRRPARRRRSSTRRPAAARARCG